jgi:predicted HAD superfamily Cof-like phosphohydrolase
MKSYFDQVVDFHKAFGLQVSEAWTPPEKELFELRANLVAEELNELSEELTKLLRGDGDPAAIAKEMADLVYVILGFAAVMGIPFDKVFEEVHRSNMSKLGKDGKPIYREDGKVLKSDLYVPANIQQFFEHLQGYFPQPKKTNE